MFVRFLHSSVVVFRCSKANTSASECFPVAPICGHRKSIGLQEVLVYALGVCLVSEGIYVHV